MTQLQKFIDALVTHHYHVPTRNVGDMYQKYIDDKVMPQKPAQSNYLVITTNRLGQIDTEKDTLLFYDCPKKIEEIRSEKVMQLSRDFEINSPYMLYRFMDLISNEKEKFLSINYDWIITERPNINLIENIRMN